MRLRTLALVFLLTYNIAQASDKESPALEHSNSATTLSGYQRECHLIDSHLENPKALIPQMIDYTLNILRNDVEFGTIKTYLPLLEGLDKISEVETKVEDFNSLSPKQKIYLNGYAGLHLEPLSQKNINTQIYEIGKLCAALLSPGMFDEGELEVISNHPYSIIKGSSAVIDKLRDPKKHEKIEKLRAMFQEMDEFKVLSKELEIHQYMMPMVFIDPSNIYELKTFFYALSKGIILYGLSVQEFPGHGRAFAHPLMAYLHDDGHAKELADMSSGFVAPEEQVARLKQCSQWMLDLFESDDVFTSKEKPLAVYSMLILFHEISMKYLILEKSFNFIDCIKNLMLTHANPLTLNKYLGLMEFERYGPEFKKRFFSDLACEIVRLKPELREEIFDQSNQENFPLNYDLDKTMAQHGILLEWLKDKVMPSLLS